MKSLIDFGPAQRRHMIQIVYVKQSARRTSLYVLAFREIGNWRDFDVHAFGCSVLNDCVHRHSEFAVDAWQDWKPVEFLNRLRGVVPSSEIGNESGIRNTSKDTPTADQRGKH